MSKSSSSRYQAIQSIDQRQPRKIANTSQRISEYYGVNTFSIKKMKEKLSRDVFQKLTSALESGKKLDSSTANAVASAIKEWALENGVTHFCHWFQPQTGLTAEKHDSFLSFDDRGAPIEHFSGSQLIQSEPDASSFPSGGMRTTFEARGYTAWDPSSPIFIMESTNGKTLCIPSAFISYHGDALDEKTPLLRSMDALAMNAKALLDTIGVKNTLNVTSTVGPEQEYFLIDRALHNLRPDLVMTGRTLLGKQPPRGQQLEDHYFGSIPERTLAFMQEVEHELYKLGVPAKTRHNEVAPSQFEMAPIFEEANVAADHNQLVMEILKRVATRHNFVLLMHEKPFAGINGSGKHCNWSMQVTLNDGTTENLLEPGKTPHQNLRFLVMLSAVLKGIHRHSGLLRTAIAVPGNDHRLGANEAPPAIISAFLGEQLSDICTKIETGANLDQNPEAALLRLGVSKIPAVLKDNTDRNRTSPFAFTGNKFEFRAVGSSMPISFPMTVVNAAVAEALGEVNDLLQKNIKSGKSLDAAILETVQKVLTESKAIRFEGNNYSEEWVEEAQKRGLPNLRKAPEAIEHLLSAAAKKLLTEQKIFSEQELHSRYHVMIERYVKKIRIEADTLLGLIDTYVVPAATDELRNLAEALTATNTVVKTSSTEQASRVSRLSDLIEQLLVQRNALEKSLEKVDQIDNETQKASVLSYEVMGLMAEVRNASDRIEEVVSDQRWPLPKYRELLFIN
ncbi:MAG: glutamine synthetase III [Bacteriovoracia bacterium]